MKKIIVFMGFILLANFANEAAAVRCGTGTTIINGRNVSDLVNGKFVCATRGSDTWRECHGTLSAPNFNTCAGSPGGPGGPPAAGGPLWDLKLGNDPVDPAEKVGDWSRIGGNVLYDYGSGQTYQYEIWRIGAGPNYDFCGTSPTGNNVLNATIQSTPCP
jgi:hypothetical protein